MNAIPVAAIIIIGAVPREENMTALVAGGLSTILGTEFDLPSEPHERYGPYVDQSIQSRFKIYANSLTFGRPFH